MQKDFRCQALCALCFLLLTLTLSSQGLAQQAASRSLSQVDISPFRRIAEDTLAIVDAGSLKRAKARIKDLETDWDRAEAKLRPRSPEQWRTIDKAIDAALLQLRADSPQAPTAKEALQNLLVELDRADQSAAVAPGQTEAGDAAKLPITDIMVEKLQAGCSVLDVSFEPKDGQPAYAVRTYANGKVWDGLLDGVTGAAIGGGTVIDESAVPTANHIRPY
jgi:soluble cytochrome b562